MSHDHAKEIRPDEYYGRKPHAGTAILALDLGTHTGWAALVDGIIRSGVTEFKPGRHEGAGMNFLRFRGWLDEFHRNVGGFKAIYYEEVRRHLGTDAAHTYGAFWGVLTSWSQEHGVPFQGVPVGTIKKFATGKGNANKEEMTNAVNARWLASIGRMVKDDNEADAIALLKFKMEQP